MVALVAAGMSNGGTVPPVRGIRLAPPYRVTASRSIQAEHLLDCIPEGYVRFSRASSAHVRGESNRVLGVLPCYQDDHRRPIIILFTCWILEVVLSLICLCASLTLALSRHSLERNFPLKRPAETVGLIFLTTLLMLYVVPISIYGYVSLRYAEPRRLRVCIVMLVAQLIVCVTLGGFLVYLLPPTEHVRLPWEYRMISAANLTLVFVISFAVHSCHVLVAAYRSFLDKLADSSDASSGGYDTFEPPGCHEQTTLSCGARV